MKERMLQTKESKKKYKQNQEDNKTHIPKNMLQRRCNKKIHSPRLSCRKNESSIGAKNNYNK
jgi:hypothetical protein